MHGTELARAGQSQDAPYVFERGAQHSFFFAAVCLAIQIFSPFFDLNGQMAGLDWASRTPSASLGHNLGLHS